MVIRSYDDMAICWCGDTMIWWYDDGMIGLYDGAMTWWNDGMTAWWYDGTIIWWYDDMIWDHRSEISDLISMILKSDLIWSWSDLISDLRSVWSKDRKKIAKYRKISKFPKTFERFPMLPSASKCVRTHRGRSGQVPACLPTYENFEQLAKTWRKLRENFAKLPRVPSLLSRGDFWLRKSVNVS